MKAALATPPLVLIGVVALFVLLGVTTGYRPFAAPADVTLPEAAGLRDLLEIEGQLRRGADPNARGQVRAGLIRSTALAVTPLEAAVGIRRLDVVELLLARGARLDAQNFPVLSCFAAREGAEEILRYLQAQDAGAAAVVECSAVTLPW